MGLASALGTALTGMSAAETTINVIGNNLANSNTVGFKESTANFATQFLQTLDPRLRPLGRQRRHRSRPRSGWARSFRRITPNFSQGTISTSSTPSDLAIQGDGHVHHAGPRRPAALHPRRRVHDERRQPVGQRQRLLLLGYGVNNQFQHQHHDADAAVDSAGDGHGRPGDAKRGPARGLPPTGHLANQASILETGVLGDAQYTGPATAATVTNAGAGSVPAGTYQYYVTYTKQRDRREPSQPHQPANQRHQTTANIQVTIPADSAANQWNGPT